MKIQSKNISVNELVRRSKIILSTVRDNIYIPSTHIPFSNQIDFLTYESEELFYGGMAGGGKSDALLMAALQYVEEKFIPEGENKLTYDALIIRRTLDDLEMPNAILDRAKHWLLPLEDKGLIKYKDIKKRFEFTSGATLSFRYLLHDKTLAKYQGAELQFIAFDELTQFPKNQYSYLHSRLRKNEDNPLPLRMRSASNPGGIGHDWVKKRFVDDNSPYPFIPSSYQDNIYLNQEEYSKQLDKIDDELTRLQLKFGDWNAQLSNGLLCNYDHLKNQLLSYEVYKDWIPSFCVIGIDPASSGTDKFAMSCLVYFTNGNLVLVDLDSTPSPSPEHVLKKFIYDNAKWKPSIINFEREAGSSPDFALKYWNNILMEEISLYGFKVKDTPSSIGSKYMRAVPHSRWVREGKLFFDKDLYFKEGLDEIPLHNLFNQYVYVHPSKEVMKNFSSPDELDSLGYAFVEIQNILSCTGSGIRSGGHIG